MCQYKLLRFGGDNLPGTRITHVSLAVGRIAILRIRVRHCVFRLVYLATYRKGSLFLWFLACHGVWPTTSWFRVLIASAVCCVFVRPPTRYLSWCSWYWRLGYKGPVSEEKRFGTTYVLFCKCFADWNLLLDSTGASARFILRQGVLINTRVRCGVCAGGGGELIGVFLLGYGGNDWSPKCFWYFGFLCQYFSDVAVRRGPMELRTQPCQSLIDYPLVWCNTIVCVMLLIWL